MADLDGLGARDELVVQVLVGALVGLVRGVAGERQEHDGVVDLVEGEPVVHEALELAEARRGIAHEVVDGLAVLPATAVLLEVERGVEVPDGHERLDAVLAHLLEHALVEGHALGIGLVLKARREETAPGDGHAELLEAHLAEEGDVLLVVVIAVDGVVVGIVILGKHGVVGALGQRAAIAHLAVVAVLVDVGDVARLGDGAAGGDVSHRHATAALLPAALVLVGRYRAAPQKALGKCHVALLSKRFIYNTSMIRDAHACWEEQSTARTPRAGTEGPAGS